MSTPATIDEYIARSDPSARPVLRRIRRTVRAAAPEAEELISYRMPSFKLDGIVVHFAAFKGHIGLFPPVKGDPKLMRALAPYAGPKGNLRFPLDRPIPLGLIRRIVLLRVRQNRARAAAPERKTRTREKAGSKGRKPTLLAGGNPQIAKGDGDGPVRAYLAALPGWKRNVGRKLDAIIVRTVPKARKAVRWNSPFYGVADQGWFLSFHCITKYIKVAFYRGTSLRPVPPVASKKKDVRYFHIHQNDQVDEKLLAGWIRQASRLPGVAWF